VDGDAFLVGGTNACTWVAAKAANKQFAVIFILMVVVFIFIFIRK